MSDYKTYLIIHQRIKSEIAVQLSQFFKNFSFSKEDFQLAVDVATEQFYADDDLERAVSVGSNILECILDRRNKKEPSDGIPHNAI